MLRKQKLSDTVSTLDTEPNPAYSHTLLIKSGGEGDVGVEKDKIKQTTVSRNRFPFRS